MRSLLAAVIALTSLSAFAGGMSDIHLQTQESINFHLYDQGVSVQKIENINFTSSGEGCDLGTKADVLVLNGDYEMETLECKVCFEERSPRNFVATGASCQ